jgi:two-component system invasion response regulator UvrY
MELVIMQKNRILIVDDQKRARDSLRALMSTWEQAGEIEEATNGLEAIGQAQIFNPNIIVMDVRMLKLDGIKAAQVIKQINPDVKIVILSMFPEYDQKSMQVCADAFISKGESPERLLAVVQLVAASITHNETSDLWIER